MSVSQPLVVESWNEWDQLTNVIVGSLDNKVVADPTEPGTKRKSTCYAKNQYPISYTCEDDMVEAKKCLENYVNIFKAEGVSVSRPNVRDFHFKSTTPTFTAETENGVTCPRDVFIIFGKHVIEASMSWRNRYFENQCYRDVMMDLFRLDKKMRWECAPKPLLTDRSYGGPLTVSRTEEILFDAADMRRFGKDVFCQDAHTMNTAGIEWVSRALRDDGIRVHTMEWDSAVNEYPSFSHLDAKISPVDDDMLIWTQREAPSQKQLNFFRENDWKVIEAPPRSMCVSAQDMTGQGIHLNMLALAPSKVVVEEGETQLIKTLREEGIDCIPIKFAPAYRYGGGLNCFTLDVTRQGRMKSYFPALDHLEERKRPREEDEQMSATVPRLD
eukprot:GEMP01023693.1.p1 GENE.GEMP01023693.1~~GEMP01023693.1.p1  ORF type:complete len:410 (+),score=75.65 GEMP01023693.1:76-1230(+)